MASLIIPRNERVELWSASIHWAMVRLRQGTMHTRAALGLPIRRGTGLLRLVDTFNLRKSDSALSPDLRARPSADLAHEVAKVGAVLGRPVPAWRDRSSPAAETTKDSLS